MRASHFAWVLLAVLFLIFLGDWLGSVERHGVRIESKMMTHEEYQQFLKQYGPPKL